MHQFTATFRRLAVLLAAVLVFAGCTGPATPGDDGPDASTTDVILAPHGLDDLDAKTVIDRLDAMPVAERPTDLMASVRADELVVSDASGNEGTLPLPEDEFYVSLAPYVSQTHDCFYHSLTTCRGELGNADVLVTIVDSAGEVVVDEQLTTYDNGFFGLWLPRDLTGTITVEYDGKAVTAPLATGPEDATCVTTMQLT